MPWKITDSEQNTVASSDRFFALPLSESFPFSGFSEAVESDHAFTFELDGRSVSWVDPVPVVPQPETAEQARQRIEAATTAYLNQKAKASAGEFDDMKSAMLRAGFPLSDWHEVGVALGNWGEQCWAFLRDQQPMIAAEFANGTRTVFPTNEEVIAALPPCPV